MCQGKLPNPSQNARLSRFNEFPWRAMVDDIFNYGSYGLAMLVASVFRSLHDRPWSVGITYQLIDKVYPGSKFIMTWRDPELWWNSVERWITVVHQDDPEKLPRYLAHLNASRLDRDEFIAGYQAHNSSVREYFRNRPGDFLEVNFEMGDGWEKLCEFLGLPIPRQPFPHAKRQNYSDEASMETAV